MVVQWLRLRTSTAGGTGSIPGQGTKIPQAAQHCQNKQTNKQTKNFTACKGENYNQSAMWDKNIYGTSLPISHPRAWTMCWLWLKIQQCLSPTGVYCVFMEMTGDLMKMLSLYVSVSSGHYLSPRQKTGVGGGLAQHQPEEFENVKAENRKTEIT